jgi:ABC-type polysaccharide/polyol phosphate export permease
VVAAVREWPMWSTLGWHDIRQRYRRSVLGPLWITLSMAIMVGTLGLIYSRVFHARLDEYLPFLCAGFVIWGFMSSSTTECCAILLESSGIIKQIRVPFSLHVLRVVWRNLIVLAHTFMIYVPVAVIFGIHLNSAILLVIPGICILFLNAVWAGIVVGILSARFQDVRQIVANLLQVAFFVTPIIWQASSFGEHTLMVELNPLHHIIELVRAPLLGQYPEPQSWIAALAWTVAGWAAAALLFRRVSQRIVYWL